jgi:tetratricopeptide (TPR) repeat protein
LNEKLGELAAAERANLATVTAAEKVYGSQGEGTGVANFSLCLFYWRQNRYAEAEKAGLAAVKIYEGIPGSSRSLLAYSLHALGDVYIDMGRNLDAEKTLKRSIALFEEIMAHSEVSKVQSSFSQALGSLGNLYGDLGRYREAQPLLERSVTLSKNPAEPEKLFWDGVARRAQDYVQTSALENLASVYYWQDKDSQAEPLYRKVLEMREKRFRRTTPSVAGASATSARSSRSSDVLPRLFRSSSGRSRSRRRSSVPTHSSSRRSSCAWPVPTTISTETRRPWRSWRRPWPSRRRSSRGRAPTRRY